MYAVGHSAHNVTTMLDQFGQELQTRWQCSFKPSSKEVLVAKGNPNDIPSNASWALVSRMNVLGHCIQNDGGTDSCFEATIRSLWRSFFSNAGKMGAKGLPIKSKMKLLDRATQPILSFRLTRWPFLKSRALQLDRIQRQMLAFMLRLHPLTGQDATDFKRWRARETGKPQREAGKWSVLWAASVINWNEHLHRARNSDTWAAQLMCLRSPEELRRRRAEFGRPNTRLRSGWIHARWFESVEHARRHAMR